jgi:hypothetical protein
VGSHFGADTHRGSRHAWDIRLISADALIKLVRLKENSDGSETGAKIRSILAPVEYTRLDELIDVMFTAATDLESAIVLEDEESTEVEISKDNHADDGSDKGSGWEFTDSKVLQAKREQIVDSFAASNDVSLIRKSRALFWDKGQ